MLAAQSIEDNFVFEEKKKSTPKKQSSVITHHELGMMHAARRNVDQHATNYNVGLFYKFTFDHDKDFLSLWRLGTGLGVEFHTTNSPEYALTVPLSYSLDFGRIYASYGLLSYEGDDDKRKAMNFLRFGLAFEYKIDRVIVGMFLFQDFIGRESFINYGLNIGYEF